MSHAQKRRKVDAVMGDSEDLSNAASTVVVQLKTAEGFETGPRVEVPLSISSGQLTDLLNDLLGNEERLPYSFFVGETNPNLECSQKSMDDPLKSVEITERLTEAVKITNLSLEQTLTITYYPQAIFRVRPVTRCTSTLPGHSEAIIVISFSPDGRRLASGSGDTNVRLWDITTETPQTTCSGHKNWILCLSWSPNGKYLVSGAMDNEIHVWYADTGAAACQPLKGHTKWTTSLAWEPLHLNPLGSRLVSASKDGTARVWDVRSGKCFITLASHGASVTCVKWGGTGFIITGSQDRSIKIWDVSGTSGKVVRELKGHAHWVNSVSLSSDFVLRCGPFDYKGDVFEDTDAGRHEAHAVATEKYNKSQNGRPERLVSCSDDFTLMLWDYTNDKKPITRMTGHQQPVNMVAFSPDGRWIASASFDKSVKLWDGFSGTFIASLRGHVGAVYQVAWSADSRQLVSGSKDSTMKLWDLKTKKIKVDLPGHADEVFTVDWSPDGSRVASGGKDRCLKLWRA